MCLQGAWSRHVVDCDSRTDEAGLELHSLSKAGSARISKIPLFVIRLRHDRLVPGCPTGSKTVFSDAVVHLFVREFSRQPSVYWFTTLQGG